MNSFWKEIRKIKKNHLFIMYSNSLAEDGYYCRAYNIFMFVCRKWKYFLSLNMNNHLENSVGGNGYSCFFFMQQLFNFSVHSKTISFLKCDIFTYSDIGEKCVLRFTPIFFAINGHNLSFPDETLPHFFNWFWRNSFCHFSLNYFYYFFIIGWMWHSDKSEFDEYLE